jgi:hypothetical protein
MPITKRQFQATVLGWLAMLGWDFFLHGGLLASFYLKESSFLLGPREAFRLIPLGYLSFLIYAILLTWVLPRFDISNWKQAFSIGLTVGLLTWGAFVLGLISISTIETPLAIAWIIGQMIEIGIAAVVIYLSLQAESLRRISLFVMFFIFLAFALTIILQNVGLAPALALSS